MLKKGDLVKVVIGDKDFREKYGVGIFVKNPPVKWRGATYKIEYDNFIFFPKRNSFKLFFNGSLEKLC